MPASSADFDFDWFLMSGVVSGVASLRAVAQIHFLSDFPSRLDKH
jgi:hypothetical protein